MNFNLSEEHEMIRKMGRDFAEKEGAPTAAERDENESFDRKIFDQMANHLLLEYFQGWFFSLNNSDL